MLFDSNLGYYFKMIWCNFKCLTNFFIMECASDCVYPNDRVKLQAWFSSANLNFGRRGKPFRDKKL